jgi:hypothetical protein
LNDSEICPLVVFPAVSNFAKSISDDDNESSVLNISSIMYIGFSIKSFSLKPLFLESASINAPYFLPRPQTYTNSYSTG